MTRMSLVNDSNRFLKFSDSIVGLLAYRAFICIRLVRIFVTLSPKIPSISSMDAVPALTQRFRSMLVIISW